MPNNSQSDIRDARFKVWGMIYHMQNSTVDPDIDPI